MGLNEPKNKPTISVYKDLKIQKFKLSLQLGINRRDTAPDQRNRNAG